MCGGCGCSPPYWPDSVPPTSQRNATTPSPRYGRPPSSSPCWPGTPRGPCRRCWGRWTGSATPRTGSHYGEDRLGSWQLAGDTCVHRGHVGSNPDWGHLGSRMGMRTSGAKYELGTSGVHQRRGSAWQTFVVRHGIGTWVTSGLRNCFGYWGHLGSEMGWGHF